MLLVCAWPTPTFETRPLVRGTDGDEHGTLLGRRQVVTLPALADQARAATRQAARKHAGPLARWPTIEEIREITGVVLWTLDDGPETDAVDRAEEQLGSVLDYLHVDTTLQQLGPAPTAG
jgi:hypothetical protein